MNMRLRRLSTESIELALDQIVRAKTSRVKASIKPKFVVMALKEILDYRQSEKLSSEEIDDLFGDISSDNPMVDEVKDLDELDEYGWVPKLLDTDNSDLIEWKMPLPNESPKLERLIPRKPDRLRDRWNNIPEARHYVGLLLFAVVLFTFGSLYLMLA